ncbi:MAG: amino acid adenylation domain-containing protein [Alphaproteobacteria bacterium]|nr:amino acid adenylation domain-containing protein [Alphaproteobacteria bacterium]MBV9372020.1 amino acid adenylation domain-containing protein [Alphaproteobacteria bacterium]MBV9901706.1 amino acid adenylation domain-containing protein [Alphaproteobacteria bacterium]
MNVHAPLSDSKRQLLEKMMRGGTERADRPPAIAPRAPDAPIPLSADQRQVWLHAIMAPDVPLYNESITIHRFGPFDREAMTRGVNEILRRHEAWRTAFVEEEGELVQRVRPHRDIDLPFDDVSHLPEGERDAAALAIGSEDARRAIDVSEAPLFRARIVKLADDNHRLYFTLHHIIFDGVSIYRVIVPELAALYEAFARGDPSPLPPPTLQYGDYAVWQKRHLESPAIRRQLDYWRKTLADAPPKLEIAGDRARPARPTHAGSMETFSIPLALTERLKGASRREGVTLYMLLLAAYHALLHRYSGEEDIVVGGVTDLRRRPELERVVGYFLNTLALRAKPRGDLAFRDFLAEVRDSVLGALAASEAPFDEVVNALELRREPGAHPLFNCLFSIEPPVDPFAEGWDLTQMDVVVGGAKFDLYLELDERPDGMIGRFLYSTELYDPATIRRMIGHWLSILERVAVDGACAIRDLPLLGAEEARRLRVEWNDTARPAGPMLLPEAVAAQARARPDAVALRFGETLITYGALDRRADAIAAMLKGAGLGRGDLVGLCLDRSPDMVAALLAVHRIGAAYLPLDPDFPTARLDYIVRDAGAAALLTQARLSETIPGCTLPRLLVEDVAETHDAVPLAPLSAEDLAYVLYTSGSTGHPKGVEIDHGALANLLAAMRERPGFGAEDSLLAVTTLSFDIAALELFLPLLAGGALIVAPRGVAADPRRLAALVAEAKPSVMQATPATWRALLETGWAGDPDLRILCGGEALPRDLAEALLARAGQVWNMYGPTETTIWSTTARVEPGDGPVPIGRPIANTQIHILDRYGNPAPIGVVGELFIGGAGLARGYRNRPDLTAERFASAPAAGGARLYRTGDLARYRADGALLCLGRVDNDEKIRGYRVAVEEIEGALARSPEVASAAVRSWPDASGERALAAYVVPHGGARPDRSGLRAHLALTLPDYMIPSHFEILPALPMTPNGKVDRKALPRPGGGRAAAAEPPSGETEARLAALWAELLRTGGIGRDDSFFELGGHSLLVARLLVRIERQWGRRVGMAEFFQAPTLRALAAHLDRGETGRLDQFVPLQPLGAGVPLIWLDGGPAYLPLAKALGAGRPFLGLELGPILDRMLRPDTRFEEIAAAVAAAIRANRPRGPYLLAGWCTNGILAFEVARQLRAAGEAVPLLAVGHSMNPVAFQRISAAEMRRSKIRYHLRVWGSLPLTRRLAYAYDRARGVLEEAGVAAPDLPEGRRRNAAALERAAYAYRPGAYEGAMALFQPADRLDVLDAAPGWAEVVAGPLEAHDIPGTHGTMIEPPNVETFAARLREALDRACPLAPSAAAA